MTTVIRRFFGVVCAGAVLSISSTAARAETLYATSYEGQLIYKVDTVLQTASPIWSTAAAGQQPDSLCFDAAGNILYSAHFPGGGVRRVNISASTDTAVATWAGHSTDIALEPSLTTVVASDYIDNNLRRVDLVNNTWSVLTPGKYFSGVAYFGNRLFANAGITYQHGGDRIVEINPVTGAILANQTPSNMVGNPVGYGDLDAMTYDPFTGHLWTTDEASSMLIEADPNNLATGWTLHPLVTGAGGGAYLPDGICGNGLGKLWYASRSDFNVYEYDIASGISTPIVYIYGLDDLAPVTGLGSFPEPTAVALIGLTVPLLHRRHRAVR
jgi:hypothetical protein